jgi:SAM-dependent methyltransferase
MLTRRHPIELVYNGFALEPLLGNGASFRVEPPCEVIAGDYVLCDQAGRTDVRRVVSPAMPGGVMTTLDSCPGGREAIALDSVLGVVRGVRGAGDGLGRLIMMIFPIWTRVSAFIYWWRRIRQAPLFGPGASDSVRDKYEQQIGGYTEQVQQPADQQSLDDLCREFPTGARILVAGSGAGGEVIYLARQGYQVTGLDFAVGMVRQSRTNATAAGISVSLLQADLLNLELGDLRFDAVYFTPLVYSFLPGRPRRIESLRRLGLQLSPGGAVMFSVQRIRTIRRAIELALWWLISRMRSDSVEYGDWFTSFLTAQGTIGRSFIHLFRVRWVVAEARSAGFRVIERCGPAHFLARGFQTGRGEEGPVP